jgi:membrane protein YdbS with pleckstrin-like domain
MYEKRNPKARLLLLTSSIITMTIVTVGVVLVLIFAEISETWIRNLMIAADIVAWIVALIAPFVRYNWYRARFTDEEIDVRQGFLMIKETIIPIERMQKISLETGPLDRMFGMSKVVVYTAGGEETIRFLDEERAKQISESLKNRINRYAVSKREQDVSVDQQDTTMNQQEESENA